MGYGKFRVVASVRDRTFCKRRSSISPSNCSAMLPAVLSGDETFGSLFEFLEAREQRRLVQVLEDQLAHRPAAITLSAHDLDPVAATAHEREPELREPPFDLVQIPADGSDGDLETARQRPQLDRLIRCKQRTEQR